MHDLILLHGAIGSSQQLEPLAAFLQSHYRIHLLNFKGHGGQALPEEDFSIPAFAASVLCYMDEQKIDRSLIFGYSMGGYVAMFLAKQFPQRVTGLATLATKFYWDEKVAALEIPQLNAGLIESKLPSFARVLEKRHAPVDWKMLLEKTIRFLLSLGKNNTLHFTDYGEIHCPCLVLLGDRDKMVTLEETLQVYQHLANAEMGMLPGTPHPIEKARVDELGSLLHSFFNRIS